MTIFVTNKNQNKMKSVSKLNSEDILTIDIETVRYTKTFDELSDGWKSAWEYKNKQDGKIPDYEDLCTMWEKNASLYAEFSKVCAIAITYIAKDGLLKCKTYKGYDEISILEEFSNDLNRFLGANSKYRLLGHAAKFYDYPFLCKRYMALGLEIPELLDESLCKPWEFKNICTNELWKAFGTGAGSSLQALCTLFDVPVSKVDLVGDEVGTAYFNNEIDRIADYCALDTIATFNVFRKFKKESIYAFDEVVYAKKEVVEKTPLMNAIANTKAITKEQEKEIVTKAKTLSKEEKPLFVELLKAALLENAVNYEKLLTKISK